MKGEQRFRAVLLGSSGLSLPLLPAPGGVWFKGYSSSVPSQEKLILSWELVGGGKVWLVLSLLPAACQRAVAFNQAWLPSSSRTLGDGTCG